LNYCRFGWRVEVIDEVDPVGRADDPGRATPVGTS